MPVSVNRLGCIGLQWLNRRALRELVLELPAGAQVPDTNAIQVQGWFGESAWQGTWKPLGGEIQIAGNRAVFRLSPKAGVVQTQKIRWIFPATAQTVVRRPTAFTRSRWQTVNLRVEAEKASKGARGEIAISNGELLSRVGNVRRENSTNELAFWTVEPSPLPPSAPSPPLRGRGKGRAGRLGRTVIQG